MSQPVYTVKDLAAYLHCDHHTIKDAITQNYAKRGATNHRAHPLPRLKAKIGLRGAYWVIDTDLHDWLNQLPDVPTKEGATPASAAPTNGEQTNNH